jgi:hypothetical protein
MDLYNANAAYSLHAQDARRAEQALERRRIASERAAELAGTRVVTARRPQRQHVFGLFGLLRGRTRSAL